MQIVQIQTFQPDADAVAAKLGAVLVGRVPDSFPVSAALWYCEYNAKRLEMRMVTSEGLIRKTPGVIGGDACVRDTRIAVWMLVESKRLGRTDAELLADYPGLTEADLNAVWGYFAAHPEAIGVAVPARIRPDVAGRDIAGASMMPEFLALID